MLRSWEDTVGTVNSPGFSLPPPSQMAASLTAASSPHALMISTHTVASNGSGASDKPSACAPAAAYLTGQHGYDCHQHVALLVTCTIC